MICHSCSSGVIACTLVKTVPDVMHVVTDMLVSCQVESWKSTLSFADGSDAMIQTQQQLRETKKGSRCPDADMQERSLSSPDHSPRGLSWHDAAAYITCIAYGEWCT